MTPLEQPDLSADVVHVDLLDALQNLNAERTRQLVQRTRRNVMETAHRMQAGRARNRQQVGVFLLVGGILAILLTPALWTITDEVCSGEHLLDTAAATMAFVIMLLCALFAVLMLLGGSRRSGRNMNL
jgi:hypothetical protein